MKMMMKSALLRAGISDRFTCPTVKLSDLGDPYADLADTIKTSEDGDLTGKFGRALGFTGIIKSRDAAMLTSRAFLFKKKKGVVVSYFNLDNRESIEELRENEFVSIIDVPKLSDSDEINVSHIMSVCHDIVDSGGYVILQSFFHFADTPLDYLITSMNVNLIGD